LGVPRSGRRVGGVARGHRAAAPEGSAGSHAVAARARVAELALITRVAELARVAARAGLARARRLTRVLPRTCSAGRERLAARRAVTARHRVASPRRLTGAPVIAGWHGGHRLATRAMGRPAGAARIHSRLIAGARRLR